MSENRVPEFIRKHRKAELYGLGSAAVGAVLFGSYAIKHRRDLQRRQGIPEVTVSAERRTELLTSFDKTISEQSELRASLLAVAARIYNATVRDPAAVVTADTLYRAGDMPMPVIKEALNIIDKFTGTVDTPNLFGRRPNPRAREDAPEGYYALLPFTEEGDIEVRCASSYYQASKEYISQRDKFAQRFIPPEIHP